MSPFSPLRSASLRRANGTAWSPSHAYSVRTFIVTSGDHHCRSVAGACVASLSRAMGSLSLAGAPLSRALARHATKAPSLWQGAGALYLGIPMLALVLLRGAPHGAMIIIALFVGDLGDRYRRADRRQSDRRAETLALALAQQDLGRNPRRHRWPRPLPKPRS